MAYYPSALESIETVLEDGSVVDSDIAASLLNPDNNGHKLNVAGGVARLFAGIGTKTESPEPATSQNNNSEVPAHETTDKYPDAIDDPTPPIYEMTAMRVGVRPEDEVKPLQEGQLEFFLWPLESVIPASDDDPAVDEPEADDQYQVSLFPATRFQRDDSSPTNERAGLRRWQAVALNTSLSILALLGAGGTGGVDTEPLI